jgi:hypothetical protein
VLFEVLTGRQPFADDDVSDTLANVLKRDLDWAALPPGLPVPLTTVLRGCLEKDRRRRIADIAAVLFVLGKIDTLAQAPSPSSAAVLLLPRVDSVSRGWLLESYWERR